MILNAPSRPNRSAGYRVLQLVLIALCAICALPISACAAGAPEAKVNIAGQPETWYGTADGMDVGHLIDYLAVPPYDLRGTFAEHGGKIEGDTTRFRLKTPKSGRMVFAVGVLTGKDKEFLGRYRSGDGWVDLPPGRVQPSFPASWTNRQLCYWIEIPAGQRETLFEFRIRSIRGQKYMEDDPIGPPQVCAALVAEAREDPFASMGEGAHPMIEVQPVAGLQKSELGRAIVQSIWRGGNPKAPISGAAYAKAIKELGQYDLIPSSHIPAQAFAWSVATGGLKYRVSGDDKYAKIAGKRAARMATWPTWGYANEWHVPADRIAGRKPTRRTARYNTLETSIITATMAIGYDLGADGMADDDRLAFRKALDFFAHRMYLESLLNPWNFYHHDNWAGHLQAAVGLSGLALRDENRYAKDWLDRFAIGMPIYVEETLDSRGVHAETIRYAGFGLNPFLLAGVTHARHGGQDIFAVRDGRMSKLARTIIYLSAPNGQMTRDFGDTAGAMQLFSHAGMPGNVETLLMALSGGSMGDFARWAALRGIHRMVGRGGQVRTVNSNQGAAPLNYLLFRPGAVKAPSPENGFPLGWHARAAAGESKDHGYVVMRTGFDSDDDIVFMLKAGFSQGGHGHPSQGSFTLDAYGDYLSQPPGYTKWGRYHTEAYNLITIDGKGQANDHSMAAGRKENDGRIERFVHSDVADLCIANNKAAYDAGDNAVRRSLRYVLFVRQPKRRGYFVVVDDMDKDGRPHEYTWNFHTTPNHRIVPAGEQAFRAKALSSAEFIELWAKRGKKNVATRVGGFRGKPGSANYGSGWCGPSKRYPWVKPSKVDLHIAFVHPAELTHKVTFQGEERRGRMRDIPDHLQVTQKGETATFFTVLRPTRGGRDKTPEMQRILADGIWGATLGDDTILFSRRKGVWSHGDIETDARLVYVRRDGAGKTAAFAVAEATTLKVAGEEVFRSETKVTAAGTDAATAATDDGSESPTPKAPRRSPPRARPAPKANPTTGLVPLTELSEPYKGRDGGLYGDGQNTPPAAHLAAAMKAAAQIQPLDAEGNPAADGKIVLLSLGMSNTFREFRAFMEIARKDESVSPHLLLVNASKGGADISRWADPNYTHFNTGRNTWQLIYERDLPKARVTPQQVQVAWIKMGKSAPMRQGEFPIHAEKFTKALVQVVQIAKKQYPNLRIAYISSRIYAGYFARGRREPYDYETAFAVRQCIQMQIAGDASLNYDPACGEVAAPVLLWGPYLWADGTNPRKSDGLTWNRDDLAKDGLHPSEPKGANKVGNMLHEFFTTHPTAKAWFAPAAASQTTGKSGSGK